MTTSARIVLFFIDGLGWGPVDDVANPTQTYGGDLFRLPDPPTDGESIRLASGAWARPIDACLGVDGLPQSATGQTTLLTGVNAAAALGRHKEAFPGPRLREILLEHSLLRTLKTAGRHAAFLNAFREPFFSWPRERQLRTSATTIANLAADNPFFDVADVVAGRSLYHDFTGAALRALGFATPLRTAAEAGAVLAAQAREYDFLLYEYFLSDRAGHARDRAGAEAELRKLDAFLAAALAGLGLAGPTDGGDGTLFLICSDHGNLEDLSVASHTRNPVPLLAWGTGAEAFVGGVAALDEVTPSIVAALASSAPPADLR
jgi:2,3-bisphosphoglycerate-independent phosphoglycerate mutase